MKKFPWAKWEMTFAVILNKRFVRFENTRAHSFDLPPEGISLDPMLSVQLLEVTFESPLAPIMDLMAFIIYYKIFAATV